ncbi:MAG: 6,7-dimethyl-8-ribityllumazine synthase [Planctomycetota bacterium]|jgi:6,7-dimethyl-8-ribityllumazine synthase
MPVKLEGDLAGRELKVAVVVARFNEFVTSRLLEGALRTLKERGLHDFNITIAWVPGAFEIPATGAKLLARQNVDAVIGIGAVIRGDTAHFDYVCQGVTHGVMQAGLAASKPFIFGVLTVDTVDQAMERAGDGADNKGSEAALTAIEMTDLFRQIGSQS